MSSYDSRGNITTSKLYAWVYNDGLDDYIIYTKSLTLDDNTILYNSDYSQYTGTEFKVTRAGDDFIIQYNSNLTEHEAAKDIASKTIYCFLFSYPMRTIWANSATAPTVVYQINGDVYYGDDWYALNNKVYYKDGNTATYNSLYNVKVPTLPVTSYVIGTTGAPTNPINSSVGAISVIKELIPDESLRTLVLNMDAALGNNPCIKDF